MARLYNQTKNALSWKMGDPPEVYECEPWGSVDIADDLVWAAHSRGLPLDITPVAPELRARTRVADEQAANQDAPLRALKEAAEAAEASERAAKLELGRVQVELNEAREALRESNELVTKLGRDLGQAKSDKDAAESLLVESGAQATASEERAMRAEAMLSDAQKSPAKPDKQKQARSE